MAPPYCPQPDPRPRPLPPHCPWLWSATPGRTSLHTSPRQVTGFPTDYYDDNTHVGIDKVCGPETIGGLRGNVYLTVTDAAGEDLQGQRAAAPEGATRWDEAEAAPAPQKCDNGTKRSVTMAELHQLAKDTILLK